MTSPTATAEIERKAREAESGPWRAVGRTRNSGYERLLTIMTERGDALHGNQLSGKDGTSIKAAEANAAYIAAVSPDVILALLAALHAAEAERDRFQRERAELYDKLNGTPCAEIRWQQEREELRETIGGALHDMGKDGHSICNYSKALLRLAYGDDPENELEYTLAEATASVISSDEMHGKLSPLRARAALQPTSAKEGES